MLQEKLRLNLFLLMFVILSTTVFSQPEQLNWVWQNPQPSGNDLHGVSMVNENTAFVVGGAGFISKTDDGGNYWIEKYGVEDVLWKYNHVFFVNEDVGYAVGEGDVHDDIMVVVRTTDGGVNWERLNLGGLEPKILNSIEFVNLDTGYVAGREGVVYRTIDGGDTWQDKSTGYGTEFNNIHFVNSKRGWVVGQWGTILRTVNAGESWELQYFTDFNLFRSVYMLDSLNGYVGGVGVFRTTNGGESWVKTKKNPPIGSVRGIHFFNKFVGLVAGAYSICMTVDGGDEWTVVYPGQEYTELFDLSFIDDKNGFAVGAYGSVVKTTDGGLTWNHLTKTSILEIRLDDIYFLDEQIGLVVGQDGVIYRTSNGGSTWELIEKNSTPIFRAIDFFDDNTGVAVGRYGIIRRTTDKGLTWHYPNLNEAGEQLFGIHVFDETFACAVGEGTIVTTTDAGLTWYRQNYPYPDWLIGVHFVTRTKGFIAAANGKIYGSIDAGVTWNAVGTLSPPEILRSIAFADEMHGVVVGDIGTVAHTTDGGLTWTKNDLGAAYLNSLFAVSFVDSVTGYAGGDGGMILKTTDAGLTWERQKSITQHRILGMHFLTADMAAITGAFSQILTTDNFGVPVFSMDKSEITFTNVPVGSTQRDSVIIYNQGNVLLRIDSILTSDKSFSVSPAKTTVFPNGSVAIIVEYHPQAEGSNEAPLAFVHNGQSSPDVVMLYGDAVTSVEDNNSLPQEFKLHQNFPNPFNPETVIKFDIPNNSRVEINIYNILGQKVAELLNKELTAGYHSVVWDASKLSSGIYFYHLKAGNQIFVKKGVLMK